MRRALAFIPLAPVAAACAVFGCGVLVRDEMVRVRRFWAELVDELERNRR